jgi:ABC-type Fe3+/spermidine/putrescine transport system ATPase subunit
MNDPHLLDVRGLDFPIGDFRLRGIDLQARAGEYHLLLGPTGSGKSTLIKCLLGLYRPTGGTILLDGEKIGGLPPERRGIGYLPQNYALFPHLDAEKNIRFGLKGRDRKEADRTVERLCGILNIDHLRRRAVRTLSGGEKQKVALARTLAVSPRVVLLDEPFSAIDESSRRFLWLEIEQALAELGVTVLHVTHHLEEAYTLGERLSVLIDGALIQSGRREEIFERPASEAVARFLNYTNIFSGRAEESEGKTEVDLGNFRITLPQAVAPGENITLCIRPQDLKVIREDAPIGDALRPNVFSGEAVALLQTPESCVMLFRIAGSRRRHDLELRFPAYIRLRLGLRAGMPVRVAAWTPNIIVFPQ